MKIQILMFYYLRDRKFSTACSLSPLEKSLGNTVFSRLFILDKVKNEYFSIRENFNSNVLLFKR